MSHGTPRHTISPSRHFPPATPLAQPTVRARHPQWRNATLQHPVVHSTPRLQIPPAPRTLLLPALPHLRSRLRHGQGYSRYAHLLRYATLRRSFGMLTCVRVCAGTLVRCDASIKAMLVDIDSKNNNEYIIEELDEEHILVKETKVNEIKSRLNMVGTCLWDTCV
jgi:TFIIH basal transcription factor complex TTD-A subunit